MAPSLKCLPGKREDVSSRTHISKGQMGWCTLVIPYLVRESQADPWGLQASTLTLLSKFQASERPCLIKVKADSSEG